MGVMETTREIQDQVIETVSAAQDAVVGAVRDFTGKPEGPVVDLSTLPGVNEVPTAREIVDNVFDFAGKVMATSRKFVSGLVDATAPLVRCEAEGKTETTAATPKPKPKTARAAKTS